MPKVDSASQTGLDRDTLGSGEQSALDRALSRTLREVYTERQDVQYGRLTDYEEELKLAAEVAKAQFDKNFDGGNPESGTFGLDRIRAGYFGYDTWFNAPDAVAGDTTTWFDNSQPDNLNGAGGRDSPLTIGEPVVHLIVGVGDLSPSPKASAFQFFLNDSPRTSVSTHEEFFNTDTRYKFFDTPVLVKDDDDVFARYQGAEDGTHAPYLIGATFIEAKDKRELVPAQMAGTDDDNIVVE